MKRFISLLTAVVLMLAVAGIPAGASAAALTASLQASLDKSSGTVTLTGSFTPGKEVALKVLTPAQAVEYVDQVQAGEDGRLELSFRLKDKSLPGLYKVSASDGTLQAQTEFGFANTAPTLSGLADQTIYMNESTASISFKVSDAETPAEKLAIKATSDNQELVADTGIALGGNGGQRTVKIAPNEDRSGVAVITISVSDGELTTSGSFKLNVLKKDEPQPENTAPTLSGLADQTIYMNESTASISFKVSDAETPAEKLAIKATSDNQELVADTGIALGGNGGQRTVKITPNEDRSGVAVITISVSDGELTTSGSFKLNVLKKDEPQPENTAPTLSGLADQTMTTKQSSLELELTVGDAETDPAALVLSASADNKEIVPDMGLSFGGEGAKRTMTITPVSGVTGKTNVTVTVSDGTLTASKSFGLSVVLANKGSSGGTGSGGSGGSGEGAAEADGVLKPQPTLDPATGTAVASVSQEELEKLLEAAGQTVVTIQLPKVEGAEAYMQELPKAVLTEGGASTSIVIVTEFGTITLPGNMLAGTDTGSAQTISIRLAQADTSKLSADVQRHIGGRPAVDVSLWVGGKQLAWSSAAAKVRIALPYQPAAEELGSPEHLTVWYLDGAGTPIPVPSGRYDAASGQVVFTTNHFSLFAVVWVSKSFSDMTGYEWAQKAVEAMAAKGVIDGTSDTTFEPGSRVTRADFTLLLMRALGLTAQPGPSFDDVRPADYYYEAVSAAKALGIVEGQANGEFNPNQSITRQDMMVISARALRAAGKLGAAGDSADLSMYADKADVASYAAADVSAMTRESLLEGSGGRIHPLDPTTRAEAAVLVYRMYSK
ncbi:S-layer homology domain-containing protein [Paenibacillus doosanensis]|uniref:S-layer homology domain-containing protein n=1 Tax=Paenibacillus doosanensis TaxID=1229154 RepID=UPI00217F71B6|nr:S-layer homology domain-containing protein [Paenibacillus doosanensis]MCS7462096.1 S-layer homology domain-containing protein [Paenibacillus doosanensis]